MSWDQTNNIYKPLPAAVTHHLSLQIRQLHITETFYRSLGSCCFFIELNLFYFHSDFQIEMNLSEPRTNTCHTASTFTSVPIYFFFEILKEFLTVKLFDE